MQALSEFFISFASMYVLWLTVLLVLVGSKLVENRRAKLLIFATAGIVFLPVALHLVKEGFDIGPAGSGELQKADELMRRSHIYTASAVPDKDLIRKALYHYERSGDQQLRPTTLISEWRCYEAVGMNEKANKCRELLAEIVPGYRQENSPDSIYNGPVFMPVPDINICSRIKSEMDDSDLDEKKLLYCLQVERSCVSSDTQMVCDYVGSGLPRCPVRGDLLLLKASAEQHGEFLKALYYDLSLETIREAVTLQEAQCYLRWFVGQAAMLCWYEIRMACHLYREASPPHAPDFRTAPFCKKWGF